MALGFKTKTKSTTGLTLKACEVGLICLKASKATLNVSSFTPCESSSERSPWAALPLDSQQGS